MPRQKKPLLNSKLLARFLEFGLRFNVPAVRAIAPFVAAITYTTLEMLNLKAIWTNKQLSFQEKLKKSMWPALIIGLTITGVLGSFISPALTIASFASIATLILLKAKSRIQRLFRINQELKDGELTTPVAWRKRITTGIKLTLATLGLTALTLSTFFPPTQIAAATLGFCLAGAQLLFMGTKTLYKKFFEPASPAPAEAVYPLPPAPHPPTTFKKDRLLLTPEDLRPHKRVCPPPRNNT